MFRAAVHDVGLLKGTEDLALLAGERADAADAAGRLDPAVVETIREAGFARHFVSPSWGGANGSFTELMRSAELLGRECASSAWCAALYASSTRFASYLPAAGHEELWGRTADVLLVTGLIPSGKARSRPDGYVVSGRWGPISGVQFADWALLCATVEGGDEDGKPRARFFVLPQADLQVRETWDNAGMRATGSHTVVVSDVFVPGHLSFDRQQMSDGANSWSDLATHNVPYQALGGPMLVTPAVGAAHGAVAALARQVAGKRLTDAMQTEIARGSARVDAAWALLLESAEVLDGQAFTAANMARNQRNASFAAEQIGEAVSGLIRAAGTSGLSNSGRLQRSWRDVTAAATHIGLRYDVTRAASNYTEALLA